MPYPISINMPITIGDRAELNTPSGRNMAIFLPLGVFSSALSPMVMGMLIDMGYGMGVLMGLNIALALLAQAGGAMMLGKLPRLAIS